MRVAYLTDIEGQWDKLATFCAGNPLVWLDQGQLTLADDTRFVFGGDAIDRGPHGMRIVDVLARAKLDYGERVVLLAGNRDINKLRLSRELRGHPPGNAPDSVRNADPARLGRWIFERTMGAPMAFEHRRTELTSAGKQVDDLEVVDSFLQDVAPDGALTRYLSLCQLTLRDGLTLYVHGGVTDTSLGFVPTQDGFNSVSDVDDWASQLNAWFRSQLEAYVAGALEPDGTPTWQPLIAYQAPARSLRFNPQSVVYTRLANEHNDPRLPPPSVVLRLSEAGIRRLVVGHMPAGDTPALLRDPARGFEVVFADNSHARVDRGSRVFLDDDAVQVAGEVVLDDQTRRSVGFTLGLDEASAVGLHMTRGGPLIKAPLDEGYLTYKALPEYRVEQRLTAAAWQPSDLVAPYA